MFRRVSAVSLRTPRQVLDRGSKVALCRRCCWGCWRAQRSSSRRGARVQTPRSLTTSCRWPAAKSGQTASRCRAPNCTRVQVLLLCTRKYSSGRIDRIRTCPLSKITWVVNTCNESSLYKGKFQTSICFYIWMCNWFMLVWVIIGLGCSLILWHIPQIQRRIHYSKILFV